MLKLTESRVSTGQRQQRSLSLLELFIQIGGAKHAQKLMANTLPEPAALILWHYGMLMHVTLIAQLVYPF